MTIDMHRATKCFCYFFFYKLTAQHVDISAEIQGKPTRIQDHVLCIPYLANLKLHCSGPGILVWAYANGSLDNDGNIINGITPIVHVNGTLNISHFDILNKGFYICTSSASTYTKESVLINSGKCYRN